ncbi:MAG: M20/M25/M40 family metallo-hydrolase [Cyclobacteriaceae bacterium]
MKPLSIAILLSLLSSFSIAQLDKTEKKLVEHINQGNEEAIVLLKEVVNINSGTMNFEGVEKVGRVFMKEFEALGMEVSWVDGAAFNRAGHMVAKIEGGKGKKFLLIGHLDTVFEKDSPNQEWIPLENGIVKGPGIADMKGGNVIILQALSALKEVGLLKKMNITVVLTGEEEKSGRPLNISKKALIDAAKWADIALGFENGDGNPKTAVVARRSSFDWLLEVSGQASHSSQIFKPTVGPGAIIEASRILNSFYTELSSIEYLTFNPGVILGGTEVKHNPKSNNGTAFGKDNVVSKNVTVSGDMRCISPEQLAEVQEKMKEIVARHYSKTDATITFGEGYPPFSLKKSNEMLLDKLSRASLDLGYGEMTAVNPVDAGAADISFTSEFVEAGLDGLGLGGTHGHTINETGDLNSLPSQTQKAAVLIYRIFKEK